MATAGDRIATSPQVRACMDATAAKIAQIDQINAQIARITTTITATEKAITTLQDEYTQQQHLYAGTIQSLIDNGANAAVIVSSLLVVECAQKANLIQQKISTTQSQITTLQNQSADLLVKITGIREEIENIQAQQIVIVQALMNGNEPPAYVRCVKVRRPIPLDS